MAKKKREITFDPDMLHLSKQQILDVLDAIIEGWQKNKKANWIYVKAAQALRVAIAFMNADVLVEVWPRIVRAFEEINNASQMKRLAGEQDDADFFFKTAIEKIRSPKFWTK